MIIKIQPDKQKAIALRKMAEITQKRLEETEIEKYPSNSLTDYYDIMHKLMEGLTLREGIKIKGEGAHTELINYIAKEHNLEEIERDFIQQMKGFTINKNFIILNRERIVDIIKKLMTLQKN
jgi:hypothetical protein